MRVNLIREEDRLIVAYYDVEEKDEYYSVNGELHEATAWNEDGSPFSTLFFADAMIKWDSCSHFWFHGESHKMNNPLNDEQEESDSYYHVCGLHNYLDFIRIMLFAHEVMVHFVGRDNILEKDELKYLRSLKLLDGYEIQYL